MKRGSFPVRLWGPNGEEETWTVIIGPPPNKKNAGYCDWDKKRIYINSRLRNEKLIQLTLLHEITHVTAGNNASEQFVINLEENFEEAADKLIKYLGTNQHEMGTC